MTIKQICLGYWYQRTGLHLAEVYDFLLDGTSPLELDKQKLKELRQGLKIDKLEITFDILEKITYESSDGISVSIFEDGLVVLRKKHKDLEDDIHDLTDYFEKYFVPAMNYLFSLGAPIPKELANIKTAFPYFIITEGANHEDLVELIHRVHEEKYFEVKNKDTTIFRGDQYFIINTAKDFAEVETLVEMLIFFKEFKAQLHHYLNLHRKIWKNVAEIKEQKSIRGRDVQDQRNLLESYKKTIELIEGRINQMGNFVGTREDIIKTKGWETILTDLLQFQYENLKHTHEYIKSLWTMTKQYTDSAVQIISEVNSLSTRNTVQALTVITSLGVVNSVLNYLGTAKYPVITRTGIFYFVVLVAGTYILNRIISYAFQVVKYKITDIKLAKNFK